jgi:hypothetical protein
VPVFLASSSGVNAPPAPAIALNNPSLSPTKVSNTPYAAPHSLTAFPINSFNFASSATIIVIQTSFGIHTKKMLLAFYVVLQILF